MKLTHEEIIEKIINLLGNVDFTMGCNGEQCIIDHIKILIDSYNDTNYKN